MLPIQLAAGIHWIGINDRTLDLFEGIWPIGREGVSYNAYIVRGSDKTAIVDLARGNKADLFFDQIRGIADLRGIHYLVVNHLEPDHSGLIVALRALAPEIEILCSAKCKEMLAGFYDMTENVRAVGDGEKLDLGGTTLEFFSAPFVHWPETMVTYETRSRVLFACDAFGGYGALQGALFDDEYEDLEFYERESLRYFVNIVAKFCRPVLKAIEKLGALDISMIAPSHGLVWRKDPGRIVELYEKWAGYGSKPAEPGVTLVYGSMYGFTEQMMGAVAEGVAQADVPLDIFDAARTHVSYILPSLWTKQGVLIGAPTYEGDLFPPVAQVLDMCKIKRVVGKTAARFGSFGWKGGAQNKVEEVAEALKWDMAETFEFCGKPSSDELEKGLEFGKRFGRKVAGR